MPRGASTIGICPACDGAYRKTVTVSEGLVAVHQCFRFWPRLRLATRCELPVLVKHSVGESDMPSFSIVVGQRPDDHRHSRKRLNIFAAQIDNYHFECVY